MIKRLRESVDMDALYSEQYCHNRWKDHILRVHLTASLAHWVGNVSSVADLSCGDGAILDMVKKITHAKTAIYGDYAPGFAIRGPIESTIHEIPEVDLFVCSETIEHVDNPSYVLENIRKKTKHMILTTPLGEDTDDNPEHLWGWDEKGMSHLLGEAGFVKDVFTTMSCAIGNSTVEYQMWVVK
jgi:hypothetical protein